MRSDVEIKQLVIDFAMRDSRVRAVLLQGSRANKNIKPDLLQDFDIVYIVDQMESFTCDYRWTSVFGEKLMWQHPDEMEIDSEERKSASFHYLMLFKDGVRIDLSLFPIEKMHSHFLSDSLTIVWLDKDRLFPGQNISSDSDYLICKPTEREFSETCNEFWWVSLNVSKGLLRREITHAKSMMEGPLRVVFMHMIEWHIGIETKFSVSFGKGGKFMEQYLSTKDFNQILATYPDAEVENIWKSLFAMTEVFSHYAKLVAANLKFKQDIAEETNAKKYLLQQFAGRK
jgi:aminoglycoside 6-adenylyltransferase